MEAFYRRERHEKITGNGGHILIIKMDILKNINMIVVENNI